MFVGRSEELRELKQRYASDKTEIVGILGRRRIGKSQLIFHSHQDFDGVVISYECSDTGYADNLSQIESLVQEKMGNRFLHFSSLYDILSYLEQEAASRKILFIIDEYPYMRDGKKTDSEIKNAIDDFNMRGLDNPLKFILCGSAVKTMEVLDDSSMPLHGRFTKVIRLLPLNYLDSASFFPDASLEDKVKYYAVLGGVPYYLKQINPNRSFDENIIDLFFSSSPLLATELENQINGEINKIEKATFILDILKNKTISYSDILQVFNATFPNGSIDYPLKKLLEMKVIEKIVVEQSNGKRKPYYRISDHSIAFYYSFLVRHYANRILFSDRDYYETFIKEKLDSSFIPVMFERIVFQFIALMNKKGALEYRLYDLFPYVINDKVTKKSYQFDVVGKTDAGLINFECKFQKDAIHASEVYAEQRQAELANQGFIETFFVSRSKVEGCDKAYYLPDMYQASLADS